MNLKYIKINVRFIILKQFLNFFIPWAAVCASTILNIIKSLLFTTIVTMIIYFFIILLALINYSCNFFLLYSSHWISFVYSDRSILHRKVFLFWQHHYFSLIPLIILFYHNENKLSVRSKVDNLVFEPYRIEL
jgi:hypothetical protein